jgi:hypothetical protein
MKDLYKRITNTGKIVILTCGLTSLLNCGKHNESVIQSATVEGLTVKLIKQENRFYYDKYTLEIYDTTNKKRISFSGGCGNIQSESKILDNNGDIKYCLDGNCYTENKKELNP